MTQPLAAERRLLAQDEYEPVLKSHYPLVEDAPMEDLIALARWLRDRRNRARDMIRERRRIASGKAAARGTASETASTRGLSAKKQVFANGLKRVNARIGALQAAKRREQAQAALHEALARKGSASRPSSGATANPGMTHIANQKRRRIIQGRRIGSVSQAGRNAQARRDS